MDCMDWGVKDTFCNFETLFMYYIKLFFFFKKLSKRSCDMDPLGLKYCSVFVAHDVNIFASLSVSLTGQQNQSGGFSRE